LVVDLKVDLNLARWSVTVIVQMSAQVIDVLLAKDYCTRFDVCHGNIGGALLPLTSSVVNLMSLLSLKLGLRFQPGDWKSDTR
jgi:hypothetical protein